MTGQNPYAPPKSAVEDIATAKIAPCPDVERACVLFWTSFCFGVIGEIIDLVRIKPFSFSGSPNWLAVAVGLLLATAFGFLVTWWITSKLRSGRNWMRWLITMVNVVSVLAILLFWDNFSLALRAYAQNVPAAIVVGLRMLIGASALVLLFTRASRDWFAAGASA